MAAIIIDVPLLDSDIDWSVANRIVKVTVSRREYIYRQDILSMLEVFFGNVHCVEAIARRQNPGEWFITLSSERLVKMLLDKVSLIWNNIRFEFCDEDTTVVNLRVHWVPRKMKHSYLANIFNAYGAVKYVSEDSTSMSGNRMLTGMRNVTLNCSALQIQNIPHMIRTAGGAIPMLITTPGRPPLCLRCHSLGHVSMNCVTGRSGRADTLGAPKFSEVVQRQASVENESRDDSMSESEEGNRGETEIGDENRQEGDMGGFSVTEVNDDCLEERTGVLIQTAEVTVIKETAEGSGTGVGESGVVDSGSIGMESIFDPPEGELGDLKSTAISLDKRSEGEVKVGGSRVGLGKTVAVKATGGKVGGSKIGGGKTGGGKEGKIILGGVKKNKKGMKF
ncbi:hypothetical protein SNE40_023678 [Patella caerulea]|uniref:Gag-like protein n=1 Tax=Patella caerulea TaxID=87958 RepID=A0AAN8IUI7_PATCE